MMEQDNETFGDWFRCPKCGQVTDGKLSAKILHGLKTTSLKLSCYQCGYKHQERDPRSPNWKTSIQLRLYLSSQYLTHPLCSSKLHEAGKCPKCTARKVQFRLWLSEGTSENISFFESNCLNCDHNYRTKVTHSG